MTATIQTTVAGLTLRFATEPDIPQILQFIRELAEYERLSHEMVADETILRDSLFGGRQVAEVVMAEQDGAPAGFALFFHNFSTFIGRPGLYLEDIYIRPDFRGRGIGAALLTFLARLARERGCGRLEWSVLDWNEPAIRFYRRLGAEPMTGWTVFRASGAPLARLAEREQSEGGA